MSGRVVPEHRVEPVDRRRLRAAPLGKLGTHARDELALDVQELRVNAHRGELDDLVQRRVEARRLDVDEEKARRDPIAASWPRFTTTPPS